ncbi:hypothetical protein HS088_TW03G01220 [Tripterygium wilfordii]|uniref:Uncharacterized protein n=1 Tax=Tripterygium wilfordii TaxID=458696 RepID=A0A7J7DWW5_TRIWF|nr:uncharacterized protein LOC119984483 [Tripterygium wilfordii]KAF5750880.1 hypothetical protein HS088_TW03G01220 [Tripterygium wilfordii]
MDSSKLALVLFLSSLFVHATLGEIVCEELPTNVCAFSISSSGKRCLLETAGKHERQCRTSEVVVERMANYIETDECVNACGVDRNSVGISSDSLLEPQFTSKLCSSACSKGCPNIVDLYFNLAAGEGAFLPEICEAARDNPHRSMVELISTSGVTGLAAGPVAAESKAESKSEDPSDPLPPPEASAESPDGEDTNEGANPPDGEDPDNEAEGPGPDGELPDNEAEGPGPSDNDPDKDEGGADDDEGDGPGDGI